MACDGIWATSKPTRSLKVMASSGCLSAPAVDQPVGTLTLTQPLERFRKRAIASQIATAPPNNAALAPAIALTQRSTVAGSRSSRSITRSPVITIIVINDYHKTR